jgi:hypothetical protein
VSLYIFDEIIGKILRGYHIEKELHGYLIDELAEESSDLIHIISYLLSKKPQILQMILYFTTFANYSSLKTF